MMYSLTIEEFDAAREEFGRMDNNAQSTDGTPPGTVIVSETGKGQFQQEVMSGPHRLLADEPAVRGGLDSGPGPYELLLAALGACTAMTIRLYADRHQLPLAGVQVRLRHQRIYAVDCAECETKAGMIDRIDSAITLEGDLNDEQRGRLLEIAEKCPVHRTLKSEVDIRTVEAPAGSSEAQTPS
jgi:uncharacterized OsmC-like protein